jgi:stearoyl-CoA desaturase (delta-9 desaturase)
MPDAVVAEAQPDHQAGMSGPTSRLGVQRISALVLIFVPLVGAAGAAAWASKDGVSWVILALAGGMYLVTGHGLSVGFHRMLAHRSFRPNRAVKIAFAIAGSMAIEGSVFTWVAQHRRHHVFADSVGDPHSPWEYGPGLGPQLRGLWHAHVGWFFAPNPSDPDRWIPDLLADGDLQVIARTATLWSWLSIILPFFLGWLLTGTIAGALLALLWASGVRILLLHHVTWAVNSIGHMFGRRPFCTRDRSTNFAPLALLSCGDSWHNAHHAYPGLARHGIDRGQIDSSALIIRFLERLRWAADANWPTPIKTARRRRIPDRAAGAGDRALLPGPDVPAGASVYGETRAGDQQ